MCVWGMDWEVDMLGAHYIHAWKSQKKTQIFVRFFLFYFSSVAKKSTASDSWWLVIVLTSEWPSNVVSISLNQGTWCRPLAGTSVPFNYSIFSMWAYMFINICHKLLLTLHVMNAMPGKYVISSPSLFCNVILSAC